MSTNVESHYSSLAQHQGSEHGFVYVVQMEESELYKIGRTVNLPRRMSEFGILLPFPYKLVTARRVGDARTTESHLHSHFSNSRLNGEWFRLTAEDLQIINLWLLRDQAAWLLRQTCRLLSAAGRPPLEKWAYLSTWAKLLHNAAVRHDRRGCALENAVESAFGIKPQLAIIVDREM